MNPDKILGRAAYIPREKLRSRPVILWPLIKFMQRPAPRELLAQVNEQIEGEA
jgi:hypothetical protein